MKRKRRETNGVRKPSPRLKASLTLMLTAFVVLCGGVLVKSLWGATSRPVTSAEMSRAARDSRRQYGQWYYLKNPSVRQSRTVVIQGSVGSLNSYGGGSVRYSGR